jgi:histidine triad (HIT) family protein
MATTTPHGSCRPRRPSANCSESAARASRKKGSSLPEDCLFCKLYREGDHVAATDGFVAIRDINPQAPIHLLVIPEHHIDSFREIAEFSADEDKRMLEFIADVAAGEGLTDYRVAVNVGPTAGQTVFHLHWHIKGGWA